MNWLKELEKILKEFPKENTKKEVPRWVRESLAMQEKKEGEKNEES